jgi:hypothetical protein
MRAGTGRDRRIVRRPSAPALSVTSALFECRLYILATVIESTRPSSDVTPSELDETRPATPVLVVTDLPIQHRQCASHPIKSSIFLEVAADHEEPLILRVVMAGRVIVSCAPTLAFAYKIDKDPVFSRNLLHERI